MSEIKSRQVSEEEAEVLRNAAKLMNEAPLPKKRKVWREWMEDGIHYGFWEEIEGELDQDLAVPE